MKRSVIKRRKRASRSTQRSDERHTSNINDPIKRNQTCGSSTPAPGTLSNGVSRLVTFKHQGSSKESNLPHTPLDSEISLFPRDMHSSHATSEKHSFSFSPGKPEKHRRISESQVNIKPWSTSPLPERVQPSPVFSSYSRSSSTQASSVRDSHSMSPQRLNDDDSIYMPPIIESKPVERHFSLPSINIAPGNIMGHQNNRPLPDLLPSISDLNPSISLNSQLFDGSKFYNGNIRLNVYCDESPLKSPSNHSTAFTNPVSAFLPHNPTKLTAYHLHSGHSPKAMKLFSDPILHSLASMRPETSKMESTNLLAPIQNLF
ncbi:hypothetical protein K7432_000078 [Basidiobolus ranarum]|uniref:Uncharacterized protein n=1 Tax=Basidiobolus ranarum TaxID=34480 RepID=A0ABR2WBU0_9FUNG